MSYAKAVETYRKAVDGYAKAYSAWTIEYLRLVASGVKSFEAEKQASVQHYGEVKMAEANMEIALDTLHKTPMEEPRA